MRQIILIATAIIFLSSSNSIPDHLSNLDDIIICLGPDKPLSMWDFERAVEVMRDHDPYATQVPQTAYAYQARKRGLNYNSCQKIIQDFNLTESESN